MEWRVIRSICSIWSACAHVAECRNFSLNIRQNADIINLHQIFRRYIMLVIIYLMNFFCRHDAFFFLGNFATVILGLLLYICANERVMFSKSVCVCVCVCVYD